MFVSLRLVLVSAAVVTASAACSGSAPDTAVTTSLSTNRQSGPGLNSSRGGLNCQTGIGFRNIDNHKTEVVQPAWSVEVLLAGRTTYDRHFDWQLPKAWPAGVLTLTSTRHAADGGRYARWQVTGTGVAHIEALGRRLAPRSLVKGEAGPTGVFEVTLTSTARSAIPGCPALPAVIESPSKS